MRRVGKGFLGVKTPLSAFILVQQQSQAKEDIEVPIAPAPPSTTNVETDKEVVFIDAESQGRLNQEDISDAELTVFDDEIVIMTMAQTLIKLKAEKAKLFDEQIA
nr:hypothetical protein [Tanacetum cinerariifolium]